MITKNKIIEKIEEWYDIFLESSPFNAMSEIFDNDNSKIVSARGRQILDELSGDELTDFINKNKCS